MAGRVCVPRWRCMSGLLRWRCLSAGWRWPVPLVFLRRSCWPFCMAAPGRLHGRWGDYRGAKIDQVKTWNRAHKTPRRGWRAFPPPVRLHFPCRRCRRRWQLSAGPLRLRCPPGAPGIFPGDFLRRSWPMACGGPPAPPRIFSQDFFTGFFPAKKSAALRRGVLCARFGFLERYILTPPIVPRFAIFAKNPRQNLCKKTSPVPPLGGRGERFSGS